MIYKMIDLCAGIGGIRRGFELAGDFQNVLSAEIDESACKTYEYLFHGDNPRNDLTTDSFKQKVLNTEYDILLAGFPCQTFSRAGNKAGFEDPTKGTIFFHIAEIISKTKPKAFFLENVDNLITHDKGKTIRTILEKLVIELDYKVIGVDQDASGNLIYSAKDFIRNSKNFGVPQNRPRTYIMGFHKEYWKDAVMTLPNKLPLARSADPIYPDLRAVLDKEAEPRYYMAQGYFETLERHRERNSNNGNGYGYRIVNSADIEHPIANTLMATGGSGKERNLVFDPQPEIYGLPMPGKHTVINNQGIRVMTPMEWGKLQGFVNYAFVDKETGQDYFEFPDGVPDGQRYKQFGNSVTIPVIEEMAHFMKACFKLMQS